MSQKEEEKKKKKKQSILEKEIFGIMEKSMKTALDAAVDDLLKDWDKEIKITSNVYMFASIDGVAQF